MTDKLKSCPFCGSENIGTAKGYVSFLLKKYRGNVRAIGCKDCGSVAGVFNTFAMSVEEAERLAIESWNRRADNER